MRFNLLKSMSQHNKIFKIITSLKRKEELKRRNCAPKILAVEKLSEFFLFVTKFSSKMPNLTLKTPIFKKVTANIDILTIKHPEFPLSGICNYLSEFCQKFTVSVDCLLYTSDAADE